MEFTSSEDLNVSIENVFRVISDVDAIERQALRRGVEVRRTSSHSALGLGMSWQAMFRFRGRKRTADIEVTEFDAPNFVGFDSSTGGLKVRFQIELISLGRNDTRMVTKAVMEPKTLSARLLVQSMKLAKSKIQRRFSVRMAQFASAIEERASRLA